MRTSAYLLLVAPLLASCAPRGDEGRNPGHGRGKGYYQPSTCVQPTSSSASPTPTSCVPITTPTKAYTIKASSPGSAIDGLLVEAGSRSFRLGGMTSTYCPQSVAAFCPPGNQTVFIGGSLSVLVPGGQQTYTEISGKLGYTQAHSLSTPLGSVPGIFGYEKCPDDEFGRVTTSIFGATGVTACPDDASAAAVYRVYAKIPNLDVPTGNPADCIDFVGLTIDYNGPLPAAWQY